MSSIVTVIPQSGNHGEKKGGGGLKRDKVGDGEDIDNHALTLRVVVRICCMGGLNLLR